MKSYLVSNIAGRKHKKIYSKIGKDAFIDLGSNQHGWVDFKNIAVDDIVFVINENQNVAVGHKVSKIADNVFLSENDEVVSETEGNTRVIFGKPSQRVDMEYSKFVRTRNIESSKIKPDSAKMLPGFNCVVFTNV